MGQLFFDLINLPVVFAQEYTVSMYDLVEQKKYSAIADKITEKKLYDELVMHPALADVWLEYSQDKRCDLGCYFLFKDGKYVVGYLDAAGLIQEKQYDNKLKACAVYIKAELEEIAKS